MSSDGGSIPPASTIFSPVKSKYQTSRSIRLPLASSKFPWLRRLPAPLSIGVIEWAFLKVQENFSKSGSFFDFWRGWTLPVFPCCLHDHFARGIVASGLITFVPERECLMPTRL